MIDIDAMKKVHMVGIGGVGMSALAHALRDRGVDVTGSDIRDSEAIAKLRDLGILITIGHDAANLQNPDVVVRTTAAKDANPELVAATNAGIPIIHRSDLLAMFVAEKRGLAVAGTHGKTTTTAMLGKILYDAGLDPTVFIGGRSLNFGDNYRLGAGQYMVLEADESDATFHKYIGCSQIITNVEADHLDQHGTFEGVKRVFARFIELGDPDGFLIYGADCPALLELAAAAPGKARSFSLKDPAADFYAADLRTTDTGASADISVNGVPVGALNLSVYGRHNIEDALAALAMANSIGVPVEICLKSLAGFSGTGRRFELVCQRGDLRLYDDYAHHPTEVRNAIAGARTAFPNAHITAVFQPHLPSRTKFFLDDFAQAFADADAVIVNSIYAAREEPIPGFSAQDLADRIAAAEPGKSVLYFTDHKHIVDYLYSNIDAEQIIMFIGAGDINSASRALADRLRAH